MNFNNNLIALRKINDISQVDFAKKIKVSRQTVSKWENGESYPELDKLVSIAELFNVSLDDLVDTKIKNKKDYQESKISKNEYNKRYHNLALFTALGLSLIIFGASLAAFFHGTKISSSILLIAFICGIILILFVGLKEKELDEIETVNYTQTEKNEFQEKFIFAQKKAIAWLILGIIIVLILKLLKVNNFLIIGYLLICVSFATYTYAYHLILRNKYKKYKLLNKDRYRNQLLIDKVCSIILLTSIIIFLIAGFIFNLWHPGWVVIIFGCIFCVLASIILE